MSVALYTVDLSCSVWLPARSSLIGDRFFPKLYCFGVLSKEKMWVAVVRGRWVAPGSCLICVVQA